MKKSTSSVLFSILRFLADLLHAWLLSASATVIFVSVLEASISRTAALVFCLSLCLFLLLFMKSRIFRLLLLFALGLAALFFIFTFCVALFTHSTKAFLETVGGFFASIGESFDIVVLAPYIVGLAASMLACLIVLHGKRFVYLYAIIPCIAMIILSLFGASFPPFAMLAFCVAAAVLVMRRKFGWFRSLLEPWPEAGADINGENDAEELIELGDNEDLEKLLRRSSVRSYSRGKFSSVRKTSGYPNLLLRAGCLLLFALLLCLILRPDPPGGPLLGEDVSKNIEIGFQNLLESNDFLRRLFGVEDPDGTRHNTRSRGSFGNLGGNNESGNEPILLVKTDRADVYLRGYTYNDYKINSWAQDPLDSAESPLSASRAVSSPLAAAYVMVPYAAQERTLAPFVYYEDQYRERLKSIDPALTGYKSLVVQYVDPYDARFGFFIPAGARSMRFYDADLNFYTTPSELHLRFTEGRSVLYTANSPNKWTLYEVTYVDNSEELIEALELYDVCRPGYYKKIFPDADTPVYSSYWGGFNNFAQYAEEVEKEYTRLPGSISDRVRNLALELTKDYDDDWHKANAIKNYLLSGKYKYNLRPGNVPKGREIVDYFLFDKPEGYCTYFATAMTVLARAAGIPARYVEGFYLGSDSLTQDNIYTLTESSLHAWCEIYMEGLGFVTIEATAGFSSAYEPGMPATARPTASPTPAATPTPTEAPPTVEPTGEPTPPEETPGASGEPTVPPTAVLTPEPTKGPDVERDFPSGAIKILIICFAAAILIFGILLLVNWLAGRRPGRAGDLRQRISSIYRQSAALTGMLGRKRDPAETPREYAEALEVYRYDVKERLPGDVVDAFGKLTGIYENSVYNRPGDAEKLLAEANGCWDDISAALTERYGKLRTKRLMLLSAAKAGQQKNAADEVAAAGTGADGIDPDGANADDAAPDERSPGAGEEQK